MSEITTVWQYFGSLIGLSISSLLYMLGGREGQGKWKRRFVGSFILALTVNIICVLRDIWHWQFLLIGPCLAIAFSNGYGADSLFDKVIRRLFYTLGVCLSGLIFCLVLGGNAWWLLIPHVGVGLWSIYMGTRNPLEASAEEGFICVLLNLGLVSYPFIG